MKKTFTIIAILILTIQAVFASPLIQPSINIEYSYDTNVFSNPLPQYERPDENGKCNWLEWRALNPFIKKHSIGANMTLNIFMNETSPIGISTSLNAKIPLKSTSIKPIAETNEGFKWKWHYESYDSLKAQKTSVFGSIGPVFIMHLPKIDLGCAIRLSLGGYDYTDSEVIMGIQAEPFMNIFVHNNIFLNFKLNYDAHLMRFIKHKTQIFEPYYQMTSLAPSIGFGFSF